MNFISKKRFDEIIRNFENQQKIIVLGDVGIDKYTKGSVTRISPEAPVPIIDVEKEWQKLGLAANISHNLKTLGMESTLCGVVGEDDKSNYFEELLEEISLKTWGIVRDKDRPTIFKERIITNTQQVCRIDYENKKPISKEIEKLILKRIEDFSKDHKAIIIEDYAKGLLTEGLLKQVIEICREKKMLVTLDPGRKVDPFFYKGVDLLKPNLLEAKLMANHIGGLKTQNMNIDEVANFLMDKLDLNKLIITLGKDGMAMLDSKLGKVKVIPTVAMEVFDVSGAGDTTISVLTACLMNGASLEEAAWVSNCAAGVVVGKMGTATVTTTELSGFYNKLEQRLGQ